MNTSKVTIGEATEIMEALSMRSATIKRDMNLGLVVCQFIGRFVFVADLHIKDTFCYLTHVRNVRYWETRENGLGDLARLGKIEGDKIDEWPDLIIPFDKLGPVMKANKEKWG